MWSETTGTGEFSSKGVRHVKKGMSRKGLQACTFYQHFGPIDVGWSYRFVVFRPSSLSLMKSVIYLLSDDLPLAGYELYGALTESYPFLQTLVCLFVHEQLFFKTNHRFLRFFASS